jgi:uncharacterized protein YdeI (YjbR/CyaY-like superfamily)
MKVRFFRAAAQFRDWLAVNHERAAELWVGFYRKETGRAGLTYAEALDEALCFGWIDGVRKKVDAVSYTNRFTPRRPRSIWSRVNTRRAEELRAAGRMEPAGLRAFAAREAARTGVYLFENEWPELSPAQRREFRANRPAWKFFCGQPPGYQRLAQAWVASAKRDETQQRRLAQLIADSAAGRRVIAVWGKP